MPSRQHTAPILIQGGRATTLVRVPLAARAFAEDWLQRLLFEHPGLLPVDELEPAFGPLLPLAREVQTGRGPVDLLLVSPEGNLTLVETKLWRNPEARRQVVGQIIDYANAMSCWSYDQLASAVRSAQGTAAGTDPVLEAARGFNEDLDEAGFIDSVSRNLARGRFLLLIVGDGIQEGVEELAGFLSRTPQLGFTLSLVELAVFRAGEEEGSVYVHPRVVARTREITRAIVEIRTPVSPADISVSLPAEGSPAARRSLTQEEWLARTQQRGGAAAAELARWIIAEAPAHGLSAEVGKRMLALYYTDPDSGQNFTFGLFGEGKASFQPLLQMCRSAGVPETVAQEYLGRVAELIPGATLRSTGQRVEVDCGGRRPDMALLAPRRREWFKAIDDAVAAIQGAIAGQPGQIPGAG